MRMLGMIPSNDDAVFLQRPVDALMLAKKHNDGSSLTIIRLNSIFPEFKSMYLSDYGPHIIFK